MHMIRTIRNIYLGMFLLFSLFVPQNASGSQIHLPFAEIAQTADLIFVGTASQESCWVNQQQTMIFTDVLFQDISVVHAKGSSLQKDSKTINLTFAGGSLGERGFKVSGTPELQMGHRYLIFAFDDGKIYANPNVGGNQGLFEVVKDAQTGESHVLTAGGKVVLGFDAEGLKMSRERVLEIRGGVLHAAESEENLVGPPSSSDPKSSAKTSHVEAAEGSPVSLEDFIHYVKNTAVTAPLKKRILKRDGQGVFYKSDGQKVQVENLKLIDPSQLPKSDEIDPKKSSWDLHVPKADANSQPVQEGERSGVVTGGTLGWCGYQNLNLVMEQVPAAWWSWDDNSNSMWTWNQCMDVYRYIDSDGTFGWPNGVNEFSGWVDAATLSSVYGFTWGSGIAMCVYRWSCSCCRIQESDVMWNPAYSWTDDFNFSLGNSGVLLLMPICMHELGHTWGYMDGTMTETYDYDQPTVMHPYYYWVVEDGWGIHRPDAYCFRRNYDNQTSILGTRDIGVESYWASNGLHNSYTNTSTYCPGSSITLNNVTVENISYNALSDVRIRFYLSTNKIITTADYQMGGYWYWASFIAEAYNTGNYTTTVPSGIPNGQYYVGAIVTIDGFGSDDYGYNNATFFYDQITVNGPVCQISPTSLNFGTMCVGSYVDKTFTITNTGGCTLNGTVSESYSHYSIVSGGGSYSLGGGQSRTVTVRFQPTSAGTKNCTIETGNSLCADVSCTGVGTAPVCLVTPTSFSFGTVCTASYLDKTFTITNIGGCMLSGIPSESCSHYSIVSGGGSYNLGAGQSRTVTVRFQPTSTGTKNCTIETGNGLCADVSCTGVGDPCCDCGVWGDVSGDGNINPVDVVYMVQHVYLDNDMRVQPPNCPLEAGDVDCNGAVNPVDVVYYVQLVYLYNDMFCPDPCI